MKPDEPAFPAVHDLHKETHGMSVRLYIAARCLQGLLAAGMDLEPNATAIEAMNMANALISEEQKTTTK